DQVLRIIPRNEEDLALLKELGEQEELQVDFWRRATGPNSLADLRVPFPSLQPVKAFLDSHGFPYTVMIEDLQGLLDEEKETMLGARRTKRSLREFDFSSYHTLDEV
ncbi:CBPA5 Carboxypeptidase, partial [Sakesphorus luctuosus]|nr:CBPA5 Carboxypeptidase [Sakesphorus luctuosus]